MLLPSKSLSLNKSSTYILKSWSHYQCPKGMHVGQECTTNAVQNTLIGSLTDLMTNGNAKQPSLPQQYSFWRLSKVSVCGPFEHKWYLVSTQKKGVALQENCTPLPHLRFGLWVYPTSRSTVYRLGNRLLCGFPSG